ncbi:MAG: acetyltransferase [Comamonadaceae bacterium]|nr:MAG: acetyltransferase [Comamonadaceae bacterium]
MDIRLATPSDAPGISRLITRLARFFTVDPSGLGAEGFLSSLQPSSIVKLVTAANYTYYVGHEGEDMVGTVALRDNSHLFHLFVAEDFHRQGKGRHLWEHAKAAAMEAGNTGRFTVNSTVFGVPAYESLGFKVVGPKTETLGIAYVPMVLDSTV